MLINHQKLQMRPHKFKSKPNQIWISKKGSQDMDLKRELFLEAKPKRKKSWNSQELVLPFKKMDKVQGLHLHQNKLTNK